jgi:NADH:ubiquinone oxidoreductase subunit 6 (subunit J)
MIFSLFSVVALLVLVGVVFGFVAQVLVYVAYIVSLSFMLWMIVDAAKQDKYIWLAIMVALPVVGSIVYFFVEKEHEYEKIPLMGSKETKNKK